MYDIILYVTVIFLSTLLAFLSQRTIIHRKEDGTAIYRKVNYRSVYAISFLILASFSCLTANGIDKEAYRFLFRENTITNLYEGIEPGFWLLIVTTKIFTHNENFFLGIVSFLTVLFVYKGVWSCKDKLSIGLAIFIFSSQYYLQSFNLMRMYLSMSILVLGARNILENKKGKFLIYILIGSSIHFSALFVLVGFFISLIMTQRGKAANRTFFIILIIATIIASSFAIGYAIQFAHLDISGKYSKYLSETTPGSIGFKVILNIVPYYLVLFLCRKYNDNKWLVSISEGFCLIVLIISLVGYSIPVLSRALYQFSVYVTIVLPACLRMYKSGKLDNVSWTHKKNKYYLILFTLFIYFILLLSLYLRDYIELDGLNNHEFIWQ